MKTVEFDPDGGPIVIAVTTLEPIVGSYTIILWGADSNNVVCKWKGNFINTDDDFFHLPTPNDKNDGRLLDCFVTVAPFPPRNSYGVRVSVSQNGSEPVVEERSGTTDQTTVTMQYFFPLEMRR